MSRSMSRSFEEPSQRKNTAEFSSTGGLIQRTLLPSLSPCLPCRAGFPSSGERRSSKLSLPPGSMLGRSPLPKTPATEIIHSKLSTHLAELRVENFALVSTQQVKLQPGLNVVTGESGSGKSVLIDALGQILGSPANDGAVRPPSRTAVVEGRFEIAAADQVPLHTMLLELGLPQRAITQPLESITIRREITSGMSGARSKCYLNGAATSLRVIRHIGEALVDVNGQHAAVGMKDPSKQLEMMDRLVKGISGARHRLSKAWRDLQEARARLQSFSELADEEHRTEMQELIDDVVTANVVKGEDINLSRYLRQLDVRRESAERCHLVSVGVGGDVSGGGILDALHDVQLHVRAVLSQEIRLKSVEEQGNDVVDEEEGDAAALLESALANFGAARDVLEEAQSCVERYGRQYRFNQGEYSAAAERLQEVQRIMKKHNASSADELIAVAEAAQASLDTFYQMEGRREDLEAEMKCLEERVANHATAISAARRGAASRLTAAVQLAFRELAMRDCRFDVKISWSPSNSNSNGIFVSEEQAAAASGYLPMCIGACSTSGGMYRMNSHGLDTIEFLFAAGPEEPLRPLSSVASGGEAARIMLAIKAAALEMSRGSVTEGEAETAVEDRGSLIDISGSNNDGEDSACFVAGGASDQLVMGLSSPIIVLDEIDAGVGSRLGQPIGRILRRIAVGGGGGGGDGPSTRGVAPRAQVLCVSHLPQVAAHAQHHVCVRKAQDGDGRVVSRFDALSSYADRLREVADMLGLPLSAAEELMRAAAEEE